MGIRGQTVLELFLLVAIIFAIIAALAPLIGKQHELNLVTGAARDGANEAATLLSLGYGSSGVALPNLSVRLQKIQETHSGGAIKLNITFSRALSLAAKNFTKYTVLKHINKALNGNFAEVTSVQGRYYTVTKNNITISP